MSTDDLEPEPLEEIDTEERELLVVDPDDYHESQRLREIHEARRRVTQTFTDCDPYTNQDEHRRQQAQLAWAIAAYYAELEPLIDAADAEPLELGNGDLPWDDAWEYATSTGYIRDEERYAGYETSMFVFRRLNQFLDEVKPVLEDKEPDEWEV